MTSAATNSANDVRGKVALLGTFVFTVTNATAVLTYLILIVTKSTIQSRKLAQLVPLVLVLAFRRGGSCFNDFVDQPDTGCDLLVRVGKNKTVKIFLGIISILIRPGLSLLYTTLSPDTDFCPTFGLHLFQTVSTRTHEKTEEIDFGEFFDWNVDLI
jgi:hypothetical protein